jgi:tRNA modification GTPase
VDTAGIRTALDPVEQLGIERSRRAAQSADLVLLTIDATAGWTGADQELYDLVCDRPLILVINKIDLIPTDCPPPYLPCPNPWSIPLPPKIRASAN